MSIPSIWPTWSTSINPLLARQPDENWPDPFLGETRVGRGCIGV